MKNETILVSKVKEIIEKFVEDGGYECIAEFRGEVVYSETGEETARWFNKELDKAVDNSHQNSDK